MEDDDLLIDRIREAAMVYRHQHGWHFSAEDLDRAADRLAELIHATKPAAASQAQSLASDPLVHPP